MERKVGKFRYAKDCEGRLISIADVDKTKGKDAYTCPGCGDEVVVCQGEKNAWYFRHKHDECSYETYLHILAKTKIYEWLRDAERIPFSRVTKNICSLEGCCPFYEPNDCDTQDGKEYNLKDYYDIPILEKSVEVGGKTFIPDIQLKPKRDGVPPMWIEIEVTHPCEDEKKQSGIRIIEFNIESERNIEKIVGRSIEEGKNAKLYNFDVKETRNFGQKPKSLSRLTLVAGQGFRDEELLCLNQFPRLVGAIAEVKSVDVVNFIEFIHSDEKKLWIFSTKSCAICAYANYKMYSAPYCNRYKRYSRMTEARICPMFRLDIAKCQERVHDVAEQYRYSPKSLWINDEWYRSLSD